MSTSTIPKRTKKHLSLTEKIDACTEWAIGETSLDAIAAKLGKSKSYMSRFFQAMGVEKGSQAGVIEAKVAEAIEAKVAEEASARAEKVKTVRDETVRVLGAIRKLVAAELSNARAKNLSQATTLNAQRALNTAADTIKKCIDSEFKALGVKEGEDDGGEELPTLTVQEMSAEDEARARASVTDEDDAVGSIDETDSIDDLTKQLDVPAEPDIEEGDSEVVSEVKTE